jgi:lysozyme
MQISEQGLDIIMEFEGFEEHAYPDPATGAEPITIGYGTTIYHDGVKVKMGDTISHDDAVYELQHYVDQMIIPVLERYVTVELTQGQIDSLASFIYNVGGTNFKKSTLLKKINAGDFDSASREFPKWNKAAGRVMAGLTRRRNAEMNLFLA